MNILILTCHTGKGHDSAAAAIAEELASRGHHCESMDALAMVSGRVSTFVCGGHVWLYRHGPGAFDRGYRLAENHPACFRAGGALSRLLGRGVEQLSAILSSGEYAAVLCTHVFAGLMMTELRLRGGSRVPTWFLATDYGCSPGVGTLDMDGWLIPDQTLTGEFVVHGVSAEKIKAPGIPVRRSIVQTVPRETARGSEGIASGHRHLVMMCGSMGCGPMEEISRELAEQLGPDMELTVVCGSNEKLRQRMLKNHAEHSGIHIRGYVEDISRLMDSADVILTKPGGISTTECAVKGIPMVFIDAVAGCETHNLQFFQQLGGAVTAKTPREIARLSCHLLSDPARRECMESALRQKDYVSAPGIIADLLTEEQTMKKCG